MNVFEVIDAGHFQKTVGNGKDAKQVCRECTNEDWPCPLILAARKQHRANRGAVTQDTTGSKA